MNFTFLVVVLLTALAFVGVVVALRVLFLPVHTICKSLKLMNVVYRHVVNHGCSFA